MEDANVTTINLEKVCRACLTESQEMHSVFSEFVIEDDIDRQVTSIFEMLTNISSMRIIAEDGLPTLICTNCMELAQASYRFQRQCNRSQLILETYVAQLQSKETEPLSIIETKDFIDVFDTGTLTETDICDTVTTNVEVLNMEGNSVVVSDSTVTIQKETNSISDIEMNAAVVAASQDNARLKQKLAMKRLENASNGSSTGFIRKKKASKAGKICIREGTHGGKEYTCEICSKSYKFISSLKIHMRTHTMEKPYVCTICGKEFKQYGTLVYHNRSHSGEQRYACKICGKRYKQSGSLTAHMRVHTGQKPFLCSVCGRGFRQAPDLRYHMRTHTKERPYMCTVCGKTMSMQCHLVQHMRTHTGERPFKCRECNKAFPSSSRLKRHEITHTDLKPYTCDVCEKSFNRSSSLRVHSKIHTDDRPHVCPICGKGFIQAHTLRGHLLIHTTRENEMCESSSANSLLN